MWLLPPLIFEDAIYLSWKWLRQDLPLVLAYAKFGVALSAAIKASFMHFILKGLKTGRGRKRPVPQGS